MYKLNDNRYIQLGGAITRTQLSTIYNKVLDKYNYRNDINKKNELDLKLNSMDNMDEQYSFLESLFNKEIPIDMFDVDSSESNMDTDSNMDTKEVNPSWNPDNFGTIMAQTGEDYHNQKLIDDGWMNPLSPDEIDQIEYERLETINSDEKLNTINNNVYDTKAVNWNTDGYLDLMQQTGLDYDEQKMIDEYIDELDRQFKEATKYKPKNYSNFNWRNNGQQKSIEAINVSDKLYEFLYSNMYSQYPDDLLWNILKNSIKTGLNSSMCYHISTTDPNAFYIRLKYIYALKNIVPDDNNYIEWYILDTIQNGLLNKSGFIANPARRLNKNYLYKHIQNLLKTPEILLENFKGLMIVCLSNFNNPDPNMQPTPNMVCFNYYLMPIETVIDNQKNIMKVFNKGDGWDNRISLNQLIKSKTEENPNITSQEIMIIWDNMYETFDPNIY